MHHTLVPVMPLIAAAAPLHVHTHTHTQSRERGITLDLGFSAFSVPLPEHLPQDKYSNLQFTLVSSLGSINLLSSNFESCKRSTISGMAVHVRLGYQSGTLVPSPTYSWPKKCTAVALLLILLQVYLHRVLPCHMSMVA